SYDFEQEHGYPDQTRAPNYEVNFRPWVQTIVASARGSSALMGWQLGNELKARNSEANGISGADAYSWYLGFTRDMVDTIRALDRNHLIFMGAQYMAELADWDYRDPASGEVLDERMPQYVRLMQQALDACWASCWNVWGLTDYDYTRFPIDDAMLMQRAGVASSMTEYGFTL